MIPVMRYHGGKAVIADWIISHFPPHDVYVEPFGGAASVLIRKPQSRAEVYNDLDGEIVNVFRVLRDPKKAKRLAEVLSLTPYSRGELELAQNITGGPVERARLTLLRAWASFSSGGATRQHCGFKTHTNKNGEYPPSSWIRVPHYIPAFTARLANVIIENRDAIRVMRQHDSPQTLHYVDPPYLPETRQMNGRACYRFELTEQGHLDLLTALRDLEGYVVISGYDHPVYRQKLSGWFCARKKTVGSGQVGGVIRQECVWLSPRTAMGQQQADLFGVRA